MSHLLASQPPQRGAVGNHTAPPETDSTRHSGGVSKIRAERLICLQYNRVHLVCAEGGPFIQASTARVRESGDPLPGRFCLFSPVRPPRTQLRQRIDIGSALLQVLPGC